MGSLVRSCLTNERQAISLTKLIKVYVEQAVILHVASGGNPLPVETGENHEKFIFKTSKKFLTKIHYVGNVEFYRHANLQVETQKQLGATKMTKSAMNSKYNYYSFCYYSLLNLSFP